MIRTLEKSDAREAVKLVQTGMNLSQTEIEEILETASAVVFDDGMLKGLAALQVTPASQQYDGMVFVYTHPNFRQNGVGTQLWKHVWGERDRLRVRRLWTHIRVDAGAQAEEFFARRGFTKVVDVDLMRYDGPKFDEPNVRSEPFDDKYFTDYIRTINDAFRRLRQEVDIQPAHIYPESAFDDGRLREKVHAKRDNIFLFFEGATLIGLTEVDGRYLESVAVIDAYQGRGYGHAITQFTVTRLMERQISPVYLGVGRPNVRARAMYERIGFHLDQTTQFRRITVEE